MPSNLPLQIPSGPLIPKDAIAFMEAVNLLLGLQIKIIKSGSFTLNQQQSLMISAQTIIMNLPILWNAGVPSNVATYSGSAGVGYNQAIMQALMDQVSALTTAINLVLAGERGWQQK